MKSYRSLLTASLLALAAAAATPAAVLAKARQIPVLVVAESFDSQHEFTLTAGQPTACSVVDAGGLVKGDPMAGDTAPDAGLVARALADALKDNYDASGASDRKLDLVYHWGLLRPVRAGLPPVTQLDPNLKARLLLVERPERVADIEKAIVHQHTTGAALSSVIQSQMYAEAMARAEDSRYYLIISAYDHAAQLRGEARLVWRTRLSATETTGPMNQVLPSLARASRAFLASDRKSPKTFRIPLDSAATAGAE